MPDLSLPVVHQTPQTTGHSVSLPVLHNAPVQLVPQQLVQIPITEGIMAQMPQRVVHVPQIEQNISLPVVHQKPQTTGHSVSLPVLHNAPVQLVPQQLVQIPTTEGIIAQMPQQVVQVPQIE